MASKYEKRKQIKKAVLDDMETRVSSEALREFRREAYPEHHERVKDMFLARKNLTFLLNRAGSLDSWERETIDRIVARIRRGETTDG